MVRNLDYLTRAASNHRGRGEDLDVLLFRDGTATPSAVHLENGTSAKDIHKELNQPPSAVVENDTSVLDTSVASPRAERELPPAVGDGSVPSASLYKLFFFNVSSWVEECNVLVS